MNTLSLVHLDLLVNLVTCVLGRVNNLTERVQVMQIVSLLIECFVAFEIGPSHVYAVDIIEQLPGQYSLDSAQEEAVAHLTDVQLLSSQQLLEWLLQGREVYAFVMGAR